MNRTPADPFCLAVNYPWVRYGQDFGRSSGAALGVSVPGTRAAVAADFARIGDAGAEVVRWFLFCDGRGGLNVSEGIPTGPDDRLFADVAAALELAEQFRLRLCFSLLDFHWLQERGRPKPGAFELPNQNVLKFAGGREALLGNVLISLFTEFRAHPALFAWEIANEPEWAIHEFVTDPAAKMPVADFREFAREIADAVREFAQARVTLGSARLLWVRAWSEIGLDLYQAHYFPETERDQKSDLAQQLAALGRLAKPLWLGELPARDPDAPEYSLETALDACKRAGLCGAGVWRWREPEAGAPDVKFGTADSGVLRAWRQRNANAFGA
jgi:hypothetical protein